MKTLCQECQHFMQVDVNGPNQERFVISHCLQYPEMFATFACSPAQIEECTQFLDHTDARNRVTNVRVIPENRFRD